MILADALDLLALSLFLGGWIVLIAHDFYERKSRTDPLAAFLFMLGAIALCILQFEKNKTIFMILASAMAIISVINWFYIPHRLKQVKNEILHAEKRLKRKKRR